MPRELTVVLRFIGDKETRQVNDEDADNFLKEFDTYLREGTPTGTICRFKNPKERFHINFAAIAYVAEEIPYIPRSA